MSERRRDGWVLLGCALVVVAGQWARRDWLIEDSAICFSYARNVVAGDGFVPFRGAERIEGVSDPTWMALLVLFQALGVDGFTSAKPMSLVFSLLLLPVCLRLARELLPESGRGAARIAPIGAALSAQLAIWTSSGLENGLWCLLLAVAMLTTWTGARAGRPLLPGLSWLALSLTRPEGLGYAAIGGFWYLVAARSAGRPWLADGAKLAGTILVPHAAFVGLRLWYFAWPFPNTYYAKIDARPTDGFAWSGRGWWQLREWADRLWTGYWFPVDLVGLVGLAGREAKLALAVVGVLAASLLWPGTDDLRALWFWPDLPSPPPWAVDARSWALTLAAFGLPALARRRPAFPLLALVWHCGAFGLLFSIRAGGDWMGAYRWMSLIVPSLAVFLALGVHELAAAVSARFPDPEGARGWSTAGWLAAALLVFGLLPPNLSQLRDHVQFNTNETPRMVRYRAEFTQGVVRRAFYEGTVVNLDMDEGAHLYWTPEFVELDMAGLVDVPLAHHRYNQRSFVEEYVFREHPPTFGHVHGWWANFTQLRSYPGWAELFELPPYDDQPPLPPHAGAFARRSLFEQPAWRPGPHRRVGFAGGVVVEGLEAPLGIAAPGAHLFLELGARVLWPRDTGFRMLGTLSDDRGHLHSFELAPGLDLFRVPDWRPDGVAVSPYAVPVPADLPAGTYDLGLVVLSPEGAVWPPGGPGFEPVGDGVQLAGDARFARGEVRFPGAIELVAPDAFEAHRLDTARRADELAAAGECGAAVDADRAARRHRPEDLERRTSPDPQVARRLADCWALDAERRPERAVASLERAHRLDPHAPELARVGEVVGSGLWESGVAARAEGRWEDAYRAFADLLRFQPHRSWARRYAEEARDHRLGLVGDNRIDPTEFGPEEER